VCILPKKPLKSGFSPLKLYEYMACGRPVVVSKNKGLEIVEQVGSGILTEAENHDALADGILWVLSHEKEAEEMGRKGREYVVNNRSWGAVAAKVLGSCNMISDK
jgi:starch synthase